MSINHRSMCRAFAVIGAVGSLGLFSCNMAKQDVPVGTQNTAEAPTINEPVTQPASPPAATGGGPTAPKGEPGVARGISAVEQYLEGKGSGVNRFALEGLNYEHACPYMKQDGVDTVDTLADLLTKHPEVKVTIEGFTDNTGPDEVNAQLSRTRAGVVKKQLVQCGIESGRIEVVGRATENPIASNDSDDGKAQNRRTEVILHK